MAHEVIANGQIRKVKVCQNGHTYISKECPYCKVMPPLPKDHAPPKNWKEAQQRYFNKS